VGLVLGGDGDRIGDRVVAERMTCAQTQGFLLIIKELIGSDICLFENCSERPFWYITRMIRDCSVAIRIWVVPNLMTSRRLAIELET
jgi:hypothetical protein